MQIKISKIIFYEKEKRLGHKKAQVARHQTKGIKRERERAITTAANPTCSYGKTQTQVVWMQGGGKECPLIHKHTTIYHLLSQKNIAYQPIKPTMKDHTMRSNIILTVTGCV